jgi:archaellum component FlaC
LSYDTHGTDPGGDQSLEARLRDAELRLAYYEKFGQTLQEHMDAVASRAATVTQEAEVEQAELKAQNDRLRHELQDGQHELHAVRDEVARLQDQVHNLQQQVRSLDEERERLHNEIIRLGRESQEIEAQNERRRAEGDAIVRQAREEVAATLADVQRHTDAVVSQAVAGLTALRTPTGPTTQPLGAPEPEKPPFQPAEERPAIEAIATRGEIGERVPTQEIEPVIGEATPPSLPPAPTPPPPVTAVPEPLAAPPAVAPPSSPVAEEPDTVVTHLVIHPSLPADKMGTLRRALEGLPGVVRTVPEHSETPTGPLLVTHAFDTSLLGSLLAIPGLDFRLVSRGEDFLEIEILEVSSLSR